MHILQIKVPAMLHCVISSQYLLPILVSTVGRIFTVISTGGSEKGKENSYKLEPHFNFSRKGQLIHMNLHQGVADKINFIRQAHMQAHEYHYTFCTQQACSKSAKSTPCNNVSHSLIYTLCLRWPLSPIVILYTPALIFLLP